MSSPSSLATILLFLLFFHIGLSVSSPSSIAIATQSQKTKLLSRKSLLTSSKDKEDPPSSISKPKLPSAAIKKKPILEAKDQIKPFKTKKSNSNTTITTTSTEVNLTKVNKTMNIATSKSKNITNLLKPKKPSKSNSTNLTKSNGKDFISEFRNLSVRLQEALIPDLARLSTTSQDYFSAANAGITNSVKPFLGNELSPKVAPLASALLIILPLFLLTSLIRRLGSYLSLRRLLLFVQAYLAIYFATLALTTVLTGHEPLRFFHAASPSSYTWTQLAQSLGYMVYLLLQVADLVEVFSSADAGEGARFLGLVQMVVGLAVGLHYYAAVFHRAVAGEAPRTGWPVHVAYAGCFLVICVCARAERRKKAYVSGEGQECGKRS